MQLARNICARYSPRCMCVKKIKKYVLYIEKRNIQTDESLSKQNPQNQTTTIRIKKQRGTLLTVLRSSETRVLISNPTP